MKAVVCNAGSTYLVCAGAMHRRYGPVRAEHSKGSEPCWQVPARERQESKRCAVKCTRLRHEEIEDQDFEETCGRGRSRSRAGYWHGVTGGGPQGWSAQSAAAFMGIWNQMHAKAGHPWTADLEATRIGCGRSQGRGIGHVAATRSRSRSRLFMVGAFQDQTQRQGASENTSVRVQAGGRLVHRYANLPGSLRRQGAAGVNCVRQRRRGTLTGQGQKTHRRRAGYPGAHQALLAKNGCTVLRTQRRPLVLCASTRQVGIRHHRKVRDRRFGGEGVVGTFGSRARLGHFRLAGPMGSQGGAGRSVHALSGWIKQRVRTELRAHGTEARSMVPAMVTEAQAHSSCEAHGAQHVGGDDQGDDRGEHAAEHREQAGQAGGDEVRAVGCVGERAIWSTRTGVGHLVRIGRTKVHSSCWVAWCGWRSATRLHEGCSFHEITCTRGCRQAAIQAGLVQASKSLASAGTAQRRADNPGNERRKNESE